MRTAVLLSVYFGGDTAYDRESFRAAGRRFPRLDLALLPIGPVEPPAFARATHLDGREALQAFVDVGARHMIPIHYDTFAHGVDPAGYAVSLLQDAMTQAAIGTDQVHIVPIGGQVALLR